MGKKCLTVIPLKCPHRIIAGFLPMNGGWTELTLAGEFWQVNLCQALIDYFAVVIEKRPAGPGMMDIGD
ncbi:MAG: hypothetical protein U9Q84_06040 [Thermodesulfobacteriota bacterium]|nr:hypothetical protein [Thermodesulfobacteriota bacterium]